MEKDPGLEFKPSSRPAALLPAVPQLVAHFTALWMSGGDGRPELGRAFTPRDRSRREKALARFVDALRGETRQMPSSPAEREAAEKRIFGAFDRFARQALDWQDRHLNILVGGGFTGAATEFVRAARGSDQAISSADVYQALRNLWVANGLQRLLGLPVRLTPAIFAYSLLYPYTDNYLDNPGTTDEVKREFNVRLRSRLEGREVAPLNPGERAIFGLVNMIERDMDRRTYPQVFESLIAIHEAQAKSLRLLRSDGPRTEEEVVAISLEKGGTSVVADGCLAAGRLEPGQTEFLFGFGAYLQLMDDLEDVVEDREAGLKTVFSRAAGREPLDGVTDRAFRFGGGVLERLDRFGVPDAEPLRELIRSSLVRGVLTTAGRFPKLYTRRYLKSLEAHSPFRFSFNNKQRRKLLRRRAAFSRLFESLASP
jgi:hypothetical protein